ncbi:MAG: DRTGG domain-containing protein [Oscillospiraceae bacterium]|jgi:predicted transcriptional regulator|nr:DRTGG domain-containing protein [Oscillospiraceae bacterium]
MTVEKLCKALGGTVVSGGAAMNENVTGYYCGDLLSRVMANAPKGCAWITVMGNVNAVAVALMAEAACILLAENVNPDPDAVEKAREKNIAVLCCGRTAGELAVAVHEALCHEQP